MQIPYKRRNEGRIQAMLEYYSFKNKMVLDVGCSTGYITNRLAEAGAYITGIDLDRQNVLEAMRTYTLPSFGVERVDVEYFNFIKKQDCIVLLAVLQHIIVNMNCYSQADYGMKAAVELMKAIRAKTDTLWFEMALPNEVQRDGADRLPDMGDRPDTWIIDNILIPAGFTKILVIEAPELTYWVNIRFFQRFLHKHFYTRLVQGPQWLRNILRFDDRDARPLFMCQ